MATAIETEGDVDRLMNFSGEAVGLLFDTGHITFAGGDALSMAKRHAKRINHVHAKDIRETVLKKLNFERQSFLDAVLLGVFTVPGDGMIDFRAVAALLADIGYEGWVVVEAEQDPKKANPLKYARIGHEALSEALTEAGYEIEQ
jgi:inosose dehydratase